MAWRASSPTIVEPLKGQVVSEIELPPDVERLDSPVDMFEAPQRDDRLDATSLTWKKPRASR